MLRVVALAVLLGCSIASETPTDDPNAATEDAVVEPAATEENVDAAPEGNTDNVVTAMTSDAGISAVVAFEEYTAKKYLDLVLNVQSAYTVRRASIALLQAFASENRQNMAEGFAEGEMMAGGEMLEENNDDDVAEADDDDDALPVDDDDQFSDLNEFARDDDKFRDLNEFAESNEGDFDEDDDIASFLQMDEEGRLTPRKRNQMTAYAYLDMFSYVKIRTVSAIMASAELQKEFFMNRGMQLKLMSLGDALPREYANLMYLQMFKTFISTQKLSATFETISTWTTWLEDELDLARSNAGDHSSGSANIGELNQDRRFAFTAFNKVAQLEWTEFMLESYIEYSMQAPAAAAAAAAAGAGAAQPGQSFLEMESQSKFVPTGLMFAGETYYAVKLYRMYVLYYSYAASTAALQSTFVKKKRIANALFHVGFTDNMINMANTQLAMAAWEFYHILTPMLQGAPQQPPAAAGPQ